MYFAGNKTCKSALLEFYASHGTAATEVPFHVSSSGSSHAPFFTCEVVMPPAYYFKGQVQIALIGLFIFDLSLHIFFSPRMEGTHSHAPITRLAETCLKIEVCMNPSHVCRAFTSLCRLLRALGEARKQQNMMQQAGQ